MNFEQAPEFAKELKKLGNRWRTLKSDLEVFQKALPPLYYQQNGVLPETTRKGFFNNKKATVLYPISSTKEIVKARLDCRALGNKKILRIVYVRDGRSITFIELYAKNDKPREDKLRIRRYLTE